MTVSLMISLAPVDVYPTRHLSHLYTLYLLRLTMVSTAVYVPASSIRLGDMICRFTFLASLMSITFMAVLSTYHARLV